MESTDSLKQAVTICTQCVHFMNLKPRSPRAHIWYNHLCKATPLPTTIDPDGKKRFYAVNDLGQEYFSDNQYQYCREVNNGNCPKFQAD